MSPVDAGVMIADEIVGQRGKPYTSDWVECEQAGGRVEPAIVVNEGEMIADTKPLIIGETGIDSLREGEDEKCDILSWQIEGGFQRGLAGLFIFSFTDDWHRNDTQVEDWTLGLTTRERKRKPSFFAVQRAFAVAPHFPHLVSIRVWPCFTERAFFSIASRISRSVSSRISCFDIAVLWQSFVRVRRRSDAHLAEIPPPASVVN